MKKRICAFLLTVIMAAATVITLSTETNASPPDGQNALSSIDPDEFANPSMEYRPGAMLWIPGGAITPEGMVASVEAMYEQGLGNSRIQPFYNGASQNQEMIDMYETPGYYEAIEAAIAKAHELDFKIDMNLGSGYCASGKSVTFEKSMMNLLIGRTRITVDGAEAGAEQAIPLPAMQRTPLYDWYRDEAGAATVGVDYYYLEWRPEEAKLKGVLISEISGQNTRFTNSNGMIDEDRNQYILDMGTAQYYDADDIAFDANDPTLMKWTPATTGNYAVIALYSVPSGGKAINMINWEVASVVDHMNAEYVMDMMESFMGEGSELRRIAKKYPGTLRGYFDDSYEFATDTIYNDILYDRAKDAQNNSLGYDLTPYLPMIFRPGSSSAMAGAEFKAPDVLYAVNSSGGNVADTDAMLRLSYDYNLLLDELMQEGLAAFSAAAGKYDEIFRSQAYNRPIMDEIGATKYIDLPEAEQRNETRLKRVSSGAHLYGKLCTAEQFSLGVEIYGENMDNLKYTYDLMTASGINNFNYHGFPYMYFGSPAAQAAHSRGEHMYGETGWTPWAISGLRICTNLNQSNSMFEAYKEFNAYCTRGNYLMQQGRASADVAVYVPGTTSLYTNGAAPGFDALDRVPKMLSDNGYTWDGINNDSILDAYYDGGFIHSGNSDVKYKAIIIQDNTVPVETMLKLEALANQGAMIVFYGANLPARQPSFAGGNYLALDAQVGDIAYRICTKMNSGQVTDKAGLMSMLSEARGSISFAANSNVRFVRRELNNGAEVAFFHNRSDNTANTSKTTVDILVDGNKFENYYWLDQWTGEIYNAHVKDNKVSVTLAPTGSVILLCEPAGFGIDEGKVSAGQPLGIKVTSILEQDAEVSIGSFNLSVTADNIGTASKGPGAITQVYDDIALGNWSSASYLNGKLQYVIDPGIYTTTFDLLPLLGKSYYLRLGNVYNVAEVRVNGAIVGTDVCSPYVLDITDALVDGVNDLEIKVTPPTWNRLVGFGNTFRSTGSTDPVYGYYDNYYGQALKNAGLEGPVSIVSTGEDKTELKNAIDQALGLNADDYTTESWQALAEALSNAQMVMADIEATFANIEDATQALQNAITGLVRVRLIEIKEIITGNKQANVNFDIRSANGKGYTVYISKTGEASSFEVYANVNYNAKGAHIKGLKNGKTYYMYIQFDDGATMESSEVVEVTLLE